VGDGTPTVFHPTPTVSRLWISRTNNRTSGDLCLYWPYSYHGSATEARGSTPLPTPAPMPVPAPAAAPPAPAPVAPSVPAVHTVTLTWAVSTSPAITAYNVYRSTTNGSGYTKIGNTTMQLTYVDTSVTNATTYYYVVTAVGAAGESGYSNQATAAIP
jgi:hypothetical protein